MSKQVVKSAPLRGTVGVVGDKSISHRALVIAALAEGRSIVRGANPGADVGATGRCLSALGARCSLASNGEWTIEGSEHGLREPADVLHAGNSGTTLRILLGPLAALSGCSVITGDATLRRRPMLRVVAPLRRMGAAIDGRRKGDLAPLAVRGRSLRGIEVSTDVPSAQVKTALLLAALSAEGRTILREPAPTRDHTERMLIAAGIEVDGGDGAIEVTGGQRPSARAWSVPGDLSGALYLIVAGLLVPGSEVTVTNVGLNPTRTAALDVLLRMGGDLRVEIEASEGGEPVGRVRARASKLEGTAIEPHEIPALIDDLPILAVAATQARGLTSLRGAGELRVKESDRIATMAGGLRRLGVRVEEQPDGLSIAGPSDIGGGLVSSAGDHRVAMSFAVAGLISSSTVRIRGWRCVDTSFPGFADVLTRAQKDDG